MQNFFNKQEAFTMETKMEKEYVRSNQEINMMVPYSKLLDEN